MTRQTSQRVRAFLWLGYAAIIILGVFERIPLIDPPSLWYDDEWVGALVRWATFSDLFVYQASAPMGFVAALKGFTSIESDPEWGLQILPMLCGLILPLLIGWVVSRETQRPTLGLFAACLFAMNPIAIGYSMRIKQFSWDALIVTVVLVVGLPMLRQINAVSLKRALLLSLTSLLSYTSIFVSAPMIHLSLVRSLGSSSDLRNAWWRLTRPVLIFDGIFLLYYVFRLREQSRSDVTAFWEIRGALPNGSLNSLAGYFLLNDHFGLTVAVGRALPFLPTLLGATLAAIALLVLWAHRPTRWTAAFFTGVYGLAICAALLGVYPFGGVRTDIFSYPITVTMIALAFGTILVALPTRLRDQASVILAASGLALLFFAAYSPQWAPVPYPQRSDSELVELLEETRDPDDLVLISQTAHHAIGYYSKLPMVYAQPRHGGFRMQPLDPQIILMEWTELYLDPEEIEPFDRIWYFDIALTPTSYEMSQKRIQWLHEAGFELLESIDRPKGSLQLLTRSEGG